MISGPTAVGKTAFAIRLAQHFRTEIISSDSRQFYSEISIGTAKPSTAELDAVPHHFIGHVSIEQLYSAGDFERDALLRLEALFQLHDVVIMVGGSGLYNKAVCEGLDDMPRADEQLRAELQNLFEREGITALQQKLQSLAPGRYNSIDTQNTQRVMRAIEIALQEEHFAPVEKKARSFECIRIALNLPRELLYGRINQRVDQMMDAGLLDEARALSSRRQLNALQTVGYTELFEYLDGSITLARAVELIKQHTRNFAKRQLTWLRREQDLHWLEPGDTEAGIALIEEKMSPGNN